MLYRMKAYLFRYRPYQFPPPNRADDSPFLQFPAWFWFHCRRIQRYWIWGAGQIFNLPRTDDSIRRGKVPSHLTAKVVNTVAFQNKIKNLSCTLDLSKSLKMNLLLIAQKTAMKARNDGMRSMASRYLGKCFGI